MQLEHLYFTSYMLFTKPELISMEVSKLEKFTVIKSNSPEMPNTWLRLKQGSNGEKQLKNCVEDGAVFFVEML